MKKLHWLLTLVLAAGVCLMFAQDQQKKPKAKQPAKAAQKAPAAMQEMMPKPAPEMEKLTRMLSGTWSAAEKHEAMGDMPAGTSKGTAVFRPGPGRLSLIEDYKANMSGMGFTGLGLVWWDPARSEYKSFWCDSMTPGGCAPGGTGKWEGENLVFNGEMEMEGQKHTMKSTYTDIKPNSVTFDMEMDGKPAMTIKYTKAAAAKPAQAKP
jgi:hypothetical protein